MIVRKKYSKQAGDTIIEVMIAITILGGVLGATFAIANRSLKATQANHERYQAQLIANEQAEWVRIFTTDTANKSTLLTSSATFCMTSASVKQAAPCTNDLYQVTITPKQMSKTTDGSGTLEYNTYYIEVVWDSLSRNGQDKVELVYGI
jgi:Tfp pilus assembly protein PilV